MTSPLRIEHSSNYSIRWWREDLKGDVGQTYQHLPFAVCIAIAKIVTRGSNGPVRVIIKDELKGKRGLR